MQSMGCDVEGAGSVPPEPVRSTGARSVTIQYENGVSVQYKPVYVHDMLCAYNSENNTQSTGIPASVGYCSTADSAGCDVEGAGCVPPEPVRSTSAGSVTT
jgi:hypothetical protein